MLMPLRLMSSVKNVWASGPVYRPPFKRKDQPPLAQSCIQYIARLVKPTTLEKIQKGDPCKTMHAHRNNACQLCKQRGHRWASCPELVVAAKPVVKLLVWVKSKVSTHEEVVSQELSVIAKIQV